MLNFKKELKLLNYPNYDSSYLNYKIVYPNGEVSLRINEACHGSARYAEVKGTDAYYLHYFKTDVYSDEDTIRWFEFVNACGFPCSYVGKENVDIKHNYVSLKGLFHIVRQDAKNYSSSKFLLAGLTALRHICYNHSNCKVPELAFEIKKAVPKIAKLRALIIACTYLCNDSGHSLYGNNFSKTNKGLTTEELYKVKDNLITVNSMCFKESAMPFARFQKLMEEKDYVTLFKEL